MRYGSLFSGIGGFDLGFDRAGMECLWQCEIDAQARSVLAKHWNVERFTDVKDVKSEHAPRPDVICGGFPCQDLSIAGQRRGLVGERSGLWFEFLRVLEEIRPGWVVIENVPGLLSSNGGRDFAVILRGLVECGYGVCWRVLDSQYFGLAQRRKRVFIVGHLGDGRAAQVLFESEGVRWDTPPRKEKGQDPSRIAGTMSANRGGQDRPTGNANELDFCVEMAAPLGSRNRPNPDGCGAYICFDEQQITSRTVRSAGSKETAYTLNQSGQMSVARCLTSRNERIDAETETLIAFDWQSGGDVRHNLNEHSTSALQASETPAIWHENKSGNLSEADTARSLRAGASHSYQGVGVRRLTPTECARLQGFPDDWNNFLADSARYKQFGNAVSVPVAEWIARRIIQASVVK